MSLFDRFQRAAFDTAKKLYGDTALWTPSGNIEEYSEKVLYNNPSDPIKLGDSDRFEYRPYNYSFEYLIGTFSDLKERVDKGKTEQVRIGECCLWVREVHSKYDGKTYIAFCELIAE